MDPSDAPVRLVPESDAAAREVVQVLEAAMDTVKKGGVRGVVVVLDLGPEHYANWYGTETRLLGLVTRVVHLINRSIDAALGKP